jgi:hypothetical protein
VVLAFGSKRSVAFAVFEWQELLAECGLVVQPEVCRESRVRSDLVAFEVAELHQLVAERKLVGDFRAHSDLVAFEVVELW